MNNFVIEQYDPHILYNAINLTVELEYKVPMQRIYKILEKVETHNQTNEKKISFQEVLEILKTLGNTLEDSALLNTTGMANGPCDGVNGNGGGSGSASLQEKIKEVLRLLNCHLSDVELNKILRGEVSLDDALSGKAKTAWLIIFDHDQNGHVRPDKDVVEQMMISAQMIALENVEMQIQRLQTERALRNEKNRAQQLSNYDNLKMARAEKELKDPSLLEKKRIQLKIYIAHMQGYDLDRDRDGGRGIDMTTGEVIDFGDIYIADKEHGSVIEDIDRDGIEIGELH